MTTVAQRSQHQHLIARAVRLCNTAGVMDFNGHVSMRDPDRPSMFWINSRAASRSTLTERDIVPVDIVSGARVGDVAEPPSEFHIHREIYALRSDVGAIVHSHPEYVNILSIAGEPLRPSSSIGSFLPEAGAPLFDTPVLINTEARGKALAAALGDAVAIVLRQHGTVTTGRTVEEAVVHMICAEENARLQYRALQVRQPKYLTGDELKNLARENWTNAYEKYWHYHNETARRRGAYDGLALVSE
jgi:ribulose-5-phosphate 4-epimerase/fuculose-1-phosphate aldolase